MQQNTLENWYTPEEAALVLTKNSERAVSAGYIRQLAHLGKITTRQIGKRMKLYLKTEIDAYVVEPRGAKLGRAMTARLHEKEIASG